MKTGIYSVIMAVVLMAALVNAQINLNADVINFRGTADRGRTTTHNGKLAVYSTVSGAILGQCTATGAADYIGVQGIARPTVSRGYGGQFEGNSAGCVGLATYASPCGTTRCGGYFSATQGTPNIGVYAEGKPITTQGNYSGYFAGYICAYGTVYPSDRKLKKDIEPAKGSLNKIMKLSPKDYAYNREEFAEMDLPAEKQHGLIADEVESVFPELIRDNVQVGMDENGQVTAKDMHFKCLNYTGLIPVLVAAIQEQQKQIEELQSALAKK
jgi:hypothetical protein